MVFFTKSEYLGSIFAIDIKITKVGIRNLSPHLRNIADNLIDCGIADKKSCGIAIADLQNLTSAIPQL
jgi:hypothetical protein